MVPVFCVPTVKKHFVVKSNIFSLHCTLESILTFEWPVFSPLFRVFYYYFHAIFFRIRPLYVRFWIVFRVGMECFFNWPNSRPLSDVFWNDYLLTLNCSYKLSAISINIPWIKTFCLISIPSLNCQNILTYISSVLTGLILWRPCK